MSNQSKHIKYLAIAGNIGAGKTTLTSKLAKDFGWKAQFESTDTNPYLSDFYDDMQRWSFNLQIYFLNHRFQQVQKILNGEDVVIQDRTIYEDAFIFAPNLHDMGLMSSRDFETYFTLFKNMSAQVKPPDLLIYLKAEIPTLVAHIQDRGRDYEGNMSLDYLKKLNQRYNNWIDGYDDGPLLVVNVDNMDFKNNVEDYGQIVEKINAQLHGLF